MEIDDIKTPLTTPLKRSYTFRNTPSRNQGAGAYDRYFKNAIKISNADLKAALFNCTLGSNKSNDESPNKKTTPLKKRSTRKTKSPDLSLESSEESDTESLIDHSTKSKTPTRSILKTPRVTRTPSTVGRKSIISRRSTIVGRITSTLTPSLQKRTQKATSSGKKELSAYEKARMKLHATNTPDCLPCRENQFSDIYTFIETHIRNQNGGCMYVCGVPGTGKTLTVRQVILCLYESVQSKLLPNFKFIDVNAFQVTEPHQIYKLIYKELTGESASVENAMMLLEKKFEHKATETVVLLVDELDMLCTKKQDILYNLFDWPYKKNSKWIVIAIANAMNLPEQVMMNKISSRLGLTRMNFQPYTFQELQTIVDCRIAELELFDLDAIKYASRKVASVSGDARRALEICRRATELAEKESSLVSIQHVDQAIKQMFSSAKITAVKHATKHEQLFLKSIASLYQKSGIEETNLNRIFEQHTMLCKYDNIKPLNRTQMTNICCALSSCKLILLEPCKNVYLQRVRLNMSADDVDFALKHNA